MTLLGGEGLARLARINHATTQQLVSRLSDVPGVTCLNTAYFNEVTLILPRDAREIVHRLADRGVLAGVSLGRLYPHAPELHHAMVVTATETTTGEDIEMLANELEGVLS